MKRVLSTGLAILLLLGLGTLAVLARPGGSDVLTSPGFAPAAPFPQAGGNVPAVASAALGSQKYSVIAMPLDARQQFADAGLTFNADGLAGLIGSGVHQVLRWEAAAQLFQARLPGVDGVNFDLEVGGVYWVLLDNTADDVVSFVGDVPAVDAISYDMLGGSPCRYNTFMVPLDQYQAGITNADQLAAAIGNVEQVLMWDAQSQLYKARLPGVDGVNFPVKIGYPYLVCLRQNTSWP